MSLIIIKHLPTECRYESLKEISKEQVTINKDELLELLYNQALLEGNMKTYKGVAEELNGDNFYKNTIKYNASNNSDILVPVEFNYITDEYNNVVFKYIQMYDDIKYKTSSIPVAYSDLKDKSFSITKDIKIKLTECYYVDTGSVVRFKGYINTFINNNDNTDTISLKFEI